MAPKFLIAIAVKLILLLLVQTLATNPSVPACNDGDIPLVLFHFNDVYDLFPTQTQPKQGAAYFKSLLDRYRKSSITACPNTSQQTLTLFAGDVFSPSLLSSMHKGENMVRPLNSFSIDVAAYGNHELDYTEPHLRKLVNATNFPWLMSNVIDVTTGRRLADGEEFVVFERSGYRIGVFSAVQPEWIATVIPEYLDKCEIQPFVDFSKKIVHKLRHQLKCTFVIALTHMMLENDRILAREVPGIDAILGGHDHLIVHEKIGDVVLVKSGSDFQHFTQVTVRKNAPKGEKRVALPGQSIIEFTTKNYHFQCILVQVHHEKMKITPDPELHEYITQLHKNFASEMHKTALYTKHDIDLTFETIRTSYSPYLRFIAQLFRYDRGADCAMINSGGFREEAVMKKGAIELRSFMNFITDDIVVKELTGENILLALENSVSMHPKHSGRYFQVAQIDFKWDRARPPYSRVINSSVRIKGSKLDLKKVYTVAFRGFIGLGGDGFGLIFIIFIYLIILKTILKRINHQSIDFAQDLSGQPLNY